MTDSKEIKELIDKIRGKTEADKTADTVDAILKAEKEIADEKAKVKAEADKKLLDDVKAAEEKIKKDLAAEAKAKKKKAADKKLTGEEEEESSEEGSEEDSEEDSEDEEETDESKIEKLTEQMDKMAGEVKALKKRKNYRTKPPKSKKVDAKDLPDFIVQNTQNIQNKDYEVMC